MTFKFRKSELDTLIRLLAVAVQTDPDDMFDKLIHTIIAGLFKKIYKMMIDQKPRYKVKFTVEEAMTFHICFFEHPFPYESHHGNLVNRLLNEINQNFSTKFHNAQS